jgi:two-component system, cell cycle response regulator CpdR
MAYILIAEDNTTVSAFLQKILKKAGYVVRVVNNSLDALRDAGSGDFDALLIGSSLPGIDGLILAQKALRANPETQVMFLAGFSAVAMDGAGGSGQAFHIRDMARHLSALLNGHLFHAATEQANGGTVVYADFTARG